MKGMTVSIALKQQVYIVQIHGVVAVNSDQIYANTRNMGDPYIDFINFRNFSVAW